MRRLCFHRCLSVHWGSLSPGGSLSGGVSVQTGVSVQGRGVSVQGRDLCPGGGGSPSRGSLSGGVSVRETPPPRSYVRAVHILLECILVFE